MKRRSLKLVLAMLLGISLSTGAASAQEEGNWNIVSARMSRAELQELLRNLELSIESPVYGGRVTDVARREAQMVRERLENGDFKVGDRIEISVAGETGIPDVVVVEPGPAITVPPIEGTVSLAGILRSELEDHLTTQIARYIRDPVVRTQSLVTLAVLGSVASPGFYQIPADALLYEAIMAAGGPMPSADMESARIVRGGEVVVDGNEMTQILTDGRTIDQLSMVAGDQIVIDAAPPPGGTSLLRTTLITVITVGVSVLLGVSSR